MAFHINPKTGEVGLCKADKACPFGEASQHFPTAAKARSAFESMQSVFPDDPFADYSTEELAIIETATLLDYSKAKRPLTAEEYDRHYEYIRRVRKGTMSTHKQFTSTVKGKAVYSDERLRQHDQIVTNLSASYNAVATEGKVLFVGGITGAGKTSIIAAHSELEAKSYASINPDEVKVEMVKLGMTPAIAGLLPLETDELIKYEAQIITEKLYSKLSAERRNLLIDRTMTNESQITKTVVDLKEKGYSQFSGVFVDIDPDEAYIRIRNRHHRGINRWLTTGEGFGERPVPGSAIAATRTDDPHYRSKNAKVFAGLVDANTFTAPPRIFDSMNDSKIIAYDNFKA